MRHPIHKPAHPSEKCWARFATALLRKRYGVSPQHLSQEEWNALYWAIAPLTPEELRGSPFMTASGATGWCGLTAIRFAPTLNNKYYLGLALFMILIGLLHDWDFVIGRHNPQFLGIMKIRTLLTNHHWPRIERRPTSILEHRQWRKAARGISRFGSGVWPRLTSEKRRWAAHPYGFQCAVLDPPMMRLRPPALAAWRPDEEPDANCKLEIGNCKLEIRN